jgi:hypothetical protein
VFVLPFVVSCFHSEAAALATLSIVLKTLVAARIGIIVDSVSWGWNKPDAGCPAGIVCTLPSYKPRLENAAHRAITRSTFTTLTGCMRYEASPRPEVNVPAIWGVENAELLALATMALDWVRIAPRLGRGSIMTLPCAASMPRSDNAATGHAVAGSVSVA